jgi:hypothetical protein
VTNNITCDTLKKELYVPVKNKIKCYDFSGNFIREYTLNSSSSHCLYHKNNLWVQSYQFLSDSVIDLITKINLTTGEITTLPFELKKGPDINKNGEVMFVAGSLSWLSLYNDEVIISFDHEKERYKIQKDKVIG